MEHSLVPNGTLIGTEWEDKEETETRRRIKKYMKKRRGRMGMTFATYLQKVYANFAEVKRHLSITHKQAWGFCARFALSLQRNIGITHKKAWGL